MKLIFKEGKQISKIGEKPIKWSDERGYYFKGVLLSRYKTEAIQILRDRITKAGNGEFLKGKDIAKDEWKLIHSEYLKSKKATNKAYETKKKYYKEIKIEKNRRKIKKLQEEIKELMNKNGQ